MLIEVFRLAIQFPFLPDFGPRVRPDTGRRPQTCAQVVCRYSFEGTGWVPGRGAMTAETDLIIAARAMLPFVVKP